MNKNLLFAYFIEWKLKNTQGKMRKSHYWKLSCSKRRESESINELHRLHLFQHKKKVKVGGEVKVEVTQMILKFEFLVEFSLIMRN